MFLRRWLSSTVRFLLLPLFMTCRRRRECEGMRWCRTFDSSVPFNDYAYTNHRIIFSHFFFFMRRDISILKQFTQFSTHWRGCTHANSSSRTTMENFIFLDPFYSQGEKSVERPVRFSIFDVASHTPHITIVVTVLAVKWTKLEDVFIFQIFPSLLSLFGGVRFVG